jgi:hypothetical protein
MRTLLVATAAMFLLVAAGAQAPQTGDSPKKRTAGFDAKRDAAKDIENAVKVARKLNKRILLDVGGEW